jgi:flagellar biosynthetic protein FlhB
MPEGADQEKTEPATPKRREEARQKGQVARSREISSVAILLGALVIFFVFGASMVQGLVILTQQFIVQAPLLEVNPGSIKSVISQVFEGFSSILLPFFIIIPVIAILSNFFQVGALFTTKPLAPDVKKLNPIKGLGRIFSKNGLVELIKSIFKIAIVGTVTVLTITGETDQIPLLADMHAWHIACYIGSIALKIIFHTSWVLIILAVMDYGFQKWNYEKNLMMSKQEIKDEMKQREGDPLIKSRIRRIQAEMARKRMMEAVPKADVVITNPVHLAVALRYDNLNMGAPMLIAKGARIIAEQIKKVACENRVPVVENKALAQSLFKMVDIGETIPESLYKAVAEVLAYVYRLKNKQQYAS